MTIGEISRRAGLRASAIRYYEELGLLPAPRREGGRRRYDEGVLLTLSLIELGRKTGFTLKEIKLLVREAAREGRLSRRLRPLMAEKLAELDERIEAARAMKRLLEETIRCDCLALSSCPLLPGARAVGGEPNAAPPRRRL
jgi:MerR family transcriptional regulator, redox-sensitive transcriptional activator SoxR